MNKVISLLIIFVAGYSVAQITNENRKVGPPEGGRGRSFHRKMHSPGGRFESYYRRLLSDSEIVKKLEIDESQRKNILEGLKKLAEKEHTLYVKLEKTAREQAELLLKKDVDKEELMGLVEVTGAIRTEIAKVRMEKLLLMRENFNHKQLEYIRNSLRDNKLHERMREKRAKPVKREQQE